MEFENIVFLSDYRFVCIVDGIANKFVQVFGVHLMCLENGIWLIFTNMLEKFEDCIFLKKSYTPIGFVIKPNSIIYSKL